MTDRATPADILSTAARDPVKPTLKDGTEQYRKAGGMPQADADFDAMNPIDVVRKGPDVRVGRLPDGTEIVVRARSVPTIEIDRPGSPPVVIRYR